MQHTRKLLAAVAAVALVGTGLGVDTATAAHERAPHKKSSATSFALQGYGYGTRVTGGDIPADSGRTAWKVIACTNEAGLSRTNNVAGADLPSLGTVDGVKTRVWTTRSHGVVSSWARNTIGKITLSDSPLGKLVLTAVGTTARAYHQDGKFKTSTHTDVAKLQFVPPTGTPMTLELPEPGQPVVIPGFAKVEIAHSATQSNPSGAKAFANGLKVTLQASGSLVRVAHAGAMIGRDIRSGLFVGKSYGIDGTAGTDLVKLGQNPLINMPCQGTGGAVRGQAAAALDLGGQVVVGAARSEQKADQSKRRAHGWERSTVASINLGDGALKIKGIVGQANVVRKGKQLRTVVASTRGTTIGTMTVNGEVQELPLDQVVEIPGVAKLEPKVVTKLHGGISVTALRVTLLDGSGAVINLGNASLRIRRPS